MSFELHRRHLFGIAYRMLGSAADADDVLQEAFLRWSPNAADVASPRAFLTTVVTRLCLDRLKEAHATKVDYVGPWLPEPIVTDDGTDKLEVAESISQAFLVVLQRLTPMERAVHLLHEVFDYSHEEIAAVVDRDVATCRKILERARKDLKANRPRFAPSKEAHRQMVMRFAMALQAGDPGELERLLADDVEALADGGGKAIAAKKPVRGREGVAKLYVGLRKLWPVDATVEVREVNGWPALVGSLSGGRVFAVLQVETDGEVIHALRSTVNPDKLGRV